MENSSTYKNLDLRTATIFDVAKLFEDKPPILISPETEMSDEQERILALYVYADHYKISDLKKQLYRLYESELLLINQ